MCFDLTQADAVDICIHIPAHLAASEAVYYGLQQQQSMPKRRCMEMRGHQYCSDGPTERPIGARLCVRVYESVDVSVRACVYACMHLSEFTVYLCAYVRMCVQSMFKYSLLTEGLYLFLFSGNS